MEQVMFWIANRINSWFHGRGMWKAGVLMGITLSFFVIPIILNFFIHTPQFKILFVISTTFSMMTNLFLIVYVRQICYDMKDRRVKRFFHERWFKSPDGAFMHLSMLGQSKGSFNVMWHRAWDMEEVLYVPSNEVLKHYGKVEFHPYALYSLQPVSKKDIAKYDLDVKLAKAFLGEKEPE
jgi:hypothetical protein